MTSRKEEARAKEIPDIVVDPASHKKYTKGKFLGKVRARTGSGVGSVICLQLLWHGEAVHGFDQKLRMIKFGCFMTVLLCWLRCVDRFAC